MCLASSLKSELRSKNDQPLLLVENRNVGFFNFYEYYNNWTFLQRRQLFERLYCCHVAGESSLLGRMRVPEICIFTFPFTLCLLLLSLSCVRAPVISLDYFYGC